MNSILSGFGVAKAWDWDLVPYRRKRKMEGWLNKFEPMIFAPFL